MNYKDYLISDHWKQIKKYIYSKVKNCSICGKHKKLNIHHLSYKNLGHEKEEDLVVLCEKCHRLFHQGLMSKKDINWKTKIKKTSEPYFFGIDHLRKLRGQSSKTRDPEPFFLDLEKCLPNIKSWDLKFLDSLCYFEYGLIRKMVEDCNKKTIDEILKIINPLNS